MENKLVRRSLIDALRDMLQDTDFQNDPHLLFIYKLVKNGGKDNEKRCTS